MRTVLLLVALMALIAGCASAEFRAHDAALRRDPAFVTAYNTCVRETAAFGFIPDLGLSREQHFYKCMRQVGWVQVPNWNPQAIGCYNRIEVVAMLERPRWGCAVAKP